MAWKKTHFKMLAVYTPMFTYFRNKNEYGKLCFIYFILLQDLPSPHLPNPSFLSPSPFLPLPSPPAHSPIFLQSCTLLPHTSSLILHHCSLPLPSSLLSVCGGDVCLSFLSRRVIWLSMVVMSGTLTLLGVPSRLSLRASCSWAWASQVYLSLTTSNSRHIDMREGRKG